VRLSFPRELIARFPPSRRYLIGVSGGRDSVALLDSLLDAGYQRLIVCHLDHRLRGRSSTADAKFVKTLAAKLKLDCELDRVDVGGYALVSADSIELATGIAATAPHTKLGGSTIVRPVLRRADASD